MGVDGPLLDVTDLRTTFRTPVGDVVAVDGVSFTLRRGETLGIVGESGSGKSMLARSVLRLVEQRNATVTGRVVLDGHDLATLSNRELRRRRGRVAAMIFQDPMTALNGTMRIGQQITESLREHLPMGRGERRAAAIDLLRSVGIPDAERHLRSYPHELSGGMRQRAMIAIALACGPKLLIADEPTTALDVTMQRQVLDLLDTEQRDRSMSMMLITHDLGVVAGRADRIMVMYAGRVVEHAPADRLFAAPRHPYTDGLLRSVPRVSDEPGRELATIPGSPRVVLDGAVGCPFAPRCDRAQPDCLDANPPLTPVDGTSEPDDLHDTRSLHEHACWYPLGTERGERALQANRAAGTTAAGLRLTDMTGSADTATEPTVSDTVARSAP
ncbi:MAG: dipeptide/oligopeptide/nickel ABC transporter ATP-binding protein [Acidimicrobiaceae bacterium]|nr:dipeptide/oligopeptide/nickel ABC transporter ATP-binding protein [Acidimicrobiaceae bacterium]